MSRRLIVDRCFAFITLEEFSYRILMNFYFLALDYCEARQISLKLLNIFDQLRRVVGVFIAPSKIRDTSQRRLKLCRFKFQPFVFLVDDARDFLFSIELFVV